MRKSWIVMLAAGAVGMTGCAKNESTPSHVRITPAITRVTGLNFDKNDCIGLTITRTSGDYVVNKMLTYDGTVFSNPDLIWYNSQQEKSTLIAYHPYSSSGFPTEFTVQADQTAGCASSDLLGAVKADVVPGAASVGMLFQHLMSQLTIVVTNHSDAAVTGVTLGGLVPVAEVDFPNLTSSVKSGAAVTLIKACKLDGEAGYRAILVPQRADLVVSVVADDGKTRSKTIPGAVLVCGKRYDLAVEVSNVDIKVSMSGEIVDWGEGGSLVGGDDSADGMLTYEGEKYRTMTIDGREWMADNLRYMPTGAELTKGVWEPIGGASAVGEQGLLYDRNTALAGQNLAKSAYVRGICPPGWHIPDSTELESLAANGNGDYFATCASCRIIFAGTDKYGVSNKGFLMSTSTPEVGSQTVLTYILPYSTSTLSNVPVEYGLSLRCVKDA